MLDPSRHLPLYDLPWDANDARLAIAEIVDDALTHFDAENFWLTHPREDGRPDGLTSLWIGATGVISALDYLRRIGATTAAFDFRPVLPHLIAVNREQFAAREYATHGSLLYGNLGTALLAMRLAPDAATADFIETQAAANTPLPVRELMWGLPGSMLACLHMSGITGEARWEALFKTQAARLLDDLQDTPTGLLWTQDLYGQHDKWMGPVHGYAGNMIPLLRGWDLLTDVQRKVISGSVATTLAQNSWQSELGATWGMRAKSEKAPGICQHCHGAPGIVTTFADAPFPSPELEALLVKGGHFTWAAGPLAKSSNLCHGTGGNGYAFLRLYRRTGDSMWLERARVFAANAIEQCRAERKQIGRGRYSLWTGDVGLAIYLWDCLTGKPYFPTVDVF